MPHSMQGSRGQVRFRGIHSPKWRKDAYRRAQDERIREMEEEVRAERIARRRQELWEEQEARRPMARLRTHVKGFVNRLFGRKTG